MRTRPIALAAVLIGIIAGCTSSADTEPAAPIEYSVGSNDVLIQVGAYDFGWPDELLTGPEIIVYGDGRAFADLPDPTPGDASNRRPVTGQLDDATVQSLLQSAASLPVDLDVGLLAVDAVPTLLAVNDQRWELGEEPDEPLAALLADVRDVIDEMQSVDWSPTQWIVRIDGGDCTLADQPITPSFHSAPMYPHLVDVDQFPDLDCGG